MSYTMKPHDVSITIDAERSRQLGFQQNGGSELEPLEWVSLLQVFKEVCAGWYKWRDDPCHAGRQQVYFALLNRYKSSTVLRWTPQIKAILDAAEAEVRAAAGKGA